MIMNKAIFYKEWIKSRIFLLGLVLVFAGFTGYTMLNLSKIVQFNGGAAVWSALITRDTVLIEALRLLPAIAGALLAVVQFLPEILQKRIKLTLHLPYPQGKIIFMMYLFGLTVLLAVFACQLAATGAVLSKWIVWELNARIIATSLVWYLAGFATYIWVAAICLEPTWKFRVILLIILAALLHLMFLSKVPESYNGFLPWLIVYVFAGQALIYHSIARFKEGMQD